MYLANQIKKVSFKREIMIGKTNTSLIEPISVLPLIKITPINSFYNNDYYGEMLNYQIKSIWYSSNLKFLISSDFGGIVIEYAFFSFLKKCIDF